MSPFLPTGSLVVGLAVVLGAFGAHGLRGRLSQERLTSFETGVRYQFYHGLALLLVGVLQATGATSGWVTAAGWLFLGGVVLFSGSIYGLTFGGPRWLGPVTPLGGLAFILGWLLLAVGTWG